MKKNPSICIVDNSRLIMVILRNGRGGTSVECIKSWVTGDITDNNRTVTSPPPLIRPLPTKCHSSDQCKYQMHRDRKILLNCPHQEMLSPFYYRRDGIIIGELPCTLYTQYSRDPILFFIRPLPFTVLSVYPNFFLFEKVRNGHRFENWTAI